MANDAGLDRAGYRRPAMTTRANSLSELFDQQRNRLAILLVLFVGVFDTLKAVAKQVLTELRRGG